MNSVMGVWLALVSLLPEEDPEDPISERFDWEASHGVFDGILEVNSWIPMNLILAGLATLLVMRLLTFLYSSLHTLWKALPFT